MIVNQQFAGRFINRDAELGYLNSRYESRKPEFIIIYGRSRVDKTRLITEFLHGKPGIYFLPVKYSESENILMLQRQMGDFPREDSFMKMRIGGFEELFDEFFRRYRGDEIDIVATGADTDGARQLFIGEVNWSNLSRHEVTRILEDLHRKSDLIRWHNDAKHENYWIIAKQIEDEEMLRSGGVYAFDLGDII